MSVSRTTAVRTSVVVAALLSVLLLATWPGTTPRAHADPIQPGCQAMNVPVTVPGIPNATIYGELCLPAGPAPDIVQLLVHGATYTHEYWDWRQQPETYSYVQHALAQGHATFNVDRLGVGKSTRPLLAAPVTLANGGEALHDVIVKLRSGDIAGGHAFDHVIWLGHSLGSYQAWVEAELYPDDIDAYVITGLGHQVDLVASLPFTTSFYPAAIDPAFAGSVLDPLYLTTQRGRRGPIFYDAALADPAVIARDEQLKNTWSTFELTDVSLLSYRAPGDAPSQSIDVPTFIVLGEGDIQPFTTCDLPNPLDCGPHVKSAESAYYGTSDLDVLIVPGGHSMNLHPGAPETYAEITDWISALDL